jgi:hypothetical protein
VHCTRHIILPNNDIWRISFNGVGIPPTPKARTNYWFQEIQD